MSLKKTGKEKQFLYLETGREKTVERAKNSRGSDSSEHDNWVIRGLCVLQLKEKMLFQPLFSASPCHPVNR